MPSALRRFSSGLRENQGKNREYGVERTSATASTPASRSSATNRSAGMLEWPMLNKSNADISIEVIAAIYHGGLPSAAPTLYKLAGRNDAGTKSTPVVVMLFVMRRFLFSLILVAPFVV